MILVLSSALLLTIFLGVIGLISAFLTVRAVVGLAILNSGCVIFTLGACCNTFSLILTSGAAVIFLNPLVRKVFGDCRMV